MTLSILFTGNSPIEREGARDWWHLTLDDDQARKFLAEHGSYLANGIPGGVWVTTADKVPQSLCIHFASVAAIEKT